MASLLIDPLPSIESLKRHLCVRLEDHDDDNKVVFYSDTIDALERCITGVMGKIRHLPLKGDDKEEEYTKGGGIIGCGRESSSRIMIKDPRRMWNDLTGDDFDDPDKVTGIRSLIRYPLKSTDVDPLIVEINLSWPLYNGMHEVFMHQGKLFTKMPIPKSLEMYTNAITHHKETFKCVPVHCEHYLPGPLPTLSGIWHHQNWSYFWPLVHSAREISRSAKLGMIGWLMGARHTVIAFDTDYTDRKYRGACQKGCPGVGAQLLLDKTADGGVWFRYRAFWENFNEEGHEYESKGDNISLADVWESTRQIDNGLMVDGGMTIDRCCQHFTKGVLQKLIDNGMVENADNSELKLRNKEIFDALDRIRAKHPWWYPEETSHQRASERWQKDLMSIYNSGGISSYIHELISSWRLRISLYQIPDF